MTRTERSLKSSAREAIDFAISDNSRSLVWSSWDGSAWTRDCSRVCDYNRDGDEEKKNNIKGLTAARMSSSTADIPSEPLREIAPDARRRS
jgi:hypothetical protein